MSHRLSDLATEILHWIPSDGDRPTEIPGLALYRRSSPTTPDIGFHEPGLVLTVQGSKRVVIGNSAYECPDHHAHLTLVDLPYVWNVTQATAARPYLALMLRFDLKLAAELIADFATGQGPPELLASGTIIAPLPDDHEDPLKRLVLLIGEPKAQAALSPLIQKEILFRLLSGPQGNQLRQMIARSARGQQIADALAFLKQHFRAPVIMADLAREVNMSTASFYRSFVATTAMTPLQYQKQLRLKEARRLMLTESLDAASASLKVGYESPSHFSREYQRAFGDSPLRHIQRLREISRNVPKWSG